MPETRLTDPHELPEDDYDQSLRPRSLSEFVGQESIKEPLSIFIEAAKRRGEALDHVLLSGPPGLGKTTLAHILSHELEVKLQSTSGPALERPGDLAGVLTSQGKGDLLFVDEIHRLSTLVEEYLYPAMEDYRLDIVIDSGPAARTVKLELAQFTLVGATTRAGLLSSPLRSRFGVVLRLNYYPAEDLAKIIRRSAGLLRVEIDGEGVTELARRSRGTPRVANRLLRRVRDYAEVRAEGKITGTVADAALKMLMIDEAGLDEMDRRMLTVLCENFGGGPTGVKTIAVAVGEEPDTIEEVHEPFLIQQGFLQRTPQGRMATLRAWEHLGLNQPHSGQRKLKF